MLDSSQSSSVILTLVIFGAPTVAPSDTESITMEKVSVLSAMMSSKMLTGIQTWEEVTPVENTMSKFTGK